MNQDRMGQMIAMGAGGGPAPSAPYSAYALANLPMNHDPVAQMIAMAAGGKMGGGGGGGGAPSIVSNLKGLPMPKASSSGTRR
jgi:hypothetical protein